MSNTNKKQITVLYFAAARDATGHSTEPIELSILGESPNLGSLNDHLISKHPLLKPILDNCVYAINMEYIDKKDVTEKQLTPGDEIAVIPPVSGG
ncbi:uncharacterized protein VTP21DRAFT_3493 [Calcarisporiella thermophila]|uniref:uncharacterized protein n=1 Tax=Calcarisporiella thermophila TaxID=911321 RepID=UPI003744B14E